MNDDSDCLIVRVIVDASNAEAYHGALAYIEAKVGAVGRLRKTSDVSYEKLGDARRIEYLATPDESPTSAFERFVASLPLDWERRSTRVPHAVWRRSDESFTEAPALIWISTEPWCDLA